MLIEIGVKHSLTLGSAIIVVVVVVAMTPTANTQATKISQWGSRMAPWVKVLAGEPGDLKYSPRTYLMEGENGLLQSCPLTSTCMHILNKN